MEEFERVQSALAGRPRGERAGLRVRPRRRRDGVVQPERVAAGALRRADPRDGAPLPQRLADAQPDRRRLRVRLLDPPRRPRCSSTTAASCPPDVAARMRAKVHVVAVDDPSPRPLAEKLLDRPDLVGRGPPPRRRAHRRDRAVERHRARGGRRPRARPAHQRQRAGPAVRGVQERAGAGCSAAPGSPYRSVARTCTRSTTWPLPPSGSGRHARAWRRW